MIILLKTLLLILLIYLPGYTFQSLFWRLRGNRDNEQWELEDIIFLRVLIGFAFLTFVGLLLVWIGLFTLTILITIVLLCCVFNFIIYRYFLGTRNEYSKIIISWHQLGILFLLVIALILWSKPSEYIFGGWDPGVYINYGVLLAKSGSMDWHNEIISLLSPEQQFPFYHVRHGMNQLFPGFILSEPTTGKFISYFMPSYPIWVGIFYMIFGLNGIFHATVLISLLGLWALYSIAKIIIGRIGALLTGALAIANVGMLWFSGFPNAESLSRLFLLGSAYGFLLWSKRKLPVLLFGGLGVLCLSLAFSVKYTPFVLLPAFILYLLIGANHMPFSKRLIWSGAVSGIAIASFWLNHSARAPHHTQMNITGLLYIFNRLQGWLISHPYELTFSGVFVVCVIAIWLKWRKIISLGMLISLASALIVIFIAVLQLSGTITENTIIYQKTPSKELGMYMSRPGLLLSLLGLLLFALRGEARIKSLPILIFSVPFIVFAIEPWVEPFHFWNGRRLTEMVLPLGFIFAAYVIISLWRAKTLGKSAGALLFIVMTVLMLRSTKPVLFHNDYSGTNDFVKGISQRFPKQALVITGGGWSMLATPLSMIHGIDALQFSDPGEINTEKLLRSLRSLLDMKMPIYYVTDIPPAFTDRVNFKKIDHRLYKTYLFERTNDRLPRNIYPLKDDLYIYKIENYNPDSYLNLERIHIDIGSNPFGLRGFSEPRSYKYIKRFFRWTGKSAKIEVNTNGWKSLNKIIITCASQRPKNVNPVDIKLYINDNLVSSFQVSRIADFTPYAFQVPDIPLNDKIIITFEATTWSPKEALRVHDERILGIQFEELKMIGENALGQMKELAIKADELPIGTIGFYSPENLEEAYKDYRYIVKEASIYIPWSKNYQPKTLTIFAGTRDKNCETKLGLFIDDRLIKLITVKGDFKKYCISIPKDIGEDVKGRIIRLTPDYLEGRLLNAWNGDRVYLLLFDPMNKLYKHWITSPDVFNELARKWPGRIGWDKILSVSPEELADYPEGSLLKHPLPISIKLDKILVSEEENNKRLIKLGWIELDE